MKNTMRLNPNARTCFTSIRIFNPLMHQTVVKVQRNLSLSRLAAPSYLKQRNSIYFLLKFILL